MNVLYELYLLTIVSRASVVQIQPEGIILIDNDMIFFAVWVLDHIFHHQDHFWNCRKTRNRSDSENVYQRGPSEIHGMYISLVIFDCNLVNLCRYE